MLFIFARVRAEQPDANFTHAVLAGATFSSAIVTGARFDHAVLDGANLAIAP